MIWDSVNDPAGIGEAVFPGWLRLLVSGFEGQRFPVSVGGNVQAKARRVFDAFQQLKLAYDWEPPESHPGKQKIRPLNEVVSQRRGTCVDLCTAFACAALDARLHPLILIVKNPRARHAIVLIPVDKTWEGGCLPVIQAPYFTDNSKDLEGSNRHLFTAQKPGDLSANWLAIDVQQATERQASWVQALEFGASYADPNGQWEWDVCIDVGAIAAQRAPDANVPSVLKAVDALSPAFLETPAAPSPLQLLSPLYGVVPYCKNTHYTALREWILPPRSSNTANSDLAIALLEGTGGSGKTRLAAELCRDLASLGWVTGFTSQTTPLTDEELRALQELGTELLLVVDDAERYREAEIARILRHLNQRSAPTRIILAGRSVSTWWENSQEEFTRDNPTLAATHHLDPLGTYQDSSLLYHRAVAAFSPYGSEPTRTSVTNEPESLASATALTIILHALLTTLNTHTNAASNTPATTADLYERVLKAEFARWQKHPALSHISVTHLGRATAVLSLLSPTCAQVDTVLSRLPEWKDAHLERGNFAELLTTALLPTPPDQSVRLQPDPIADHLIATTFDGDTELLNQILPQPPLTPAETPSATPALASSDTVAQERNACETITRFSTAYSVAATELAEACLHYRPHMWQAAFETALAQGGPFAAALQTLVENNADLPLETLNAAIPLGHSWLRPLAVHVAERFSDEASISGGEKAKRLLKLSNRLSKNGDSEGALSAIQEAVSIYRALPAQNTAAHDLELAAALNSLAICQSDNGEYDCALTTAQEATTLLLELATQTPSVYIFPFADSLNNLALCQAKTGDYVAALTTAEKAVNIRRDLYAQNPTAYNSDLATAINNQSVFHANTGNQAAALTTAEEAVNFYRQLTAQNPVTFNPDLAMALNNLALCQAEGNDLASAGATIEKAVNLFRELAAQNPTAFNPYFAMALNNFATIQAKAGDSTAALNTSEEAVNIRRKLATQYPAAYTHDFASSLINLAAFQAETGNHATAQTTAQEAVNLYRELAAQSPTTHRPRLALSIHNLALCQAKGGNSAGALVTIEEAVNIRRELAAQNPTACNSDLADSLINLAAFQTENANHESALSTVKEATGIYRELSIQNPGVYTPRLARALYNLSACLTETGSHTAALTTAEEAVDLFRQLAAQDAAAYIPELVACLDSLTARLAEAGNLTGTLATMKEAKSIRRQIVTRANTSYNADLPLALNNLAVRLAKTGNHPVALTIIEEAVTTYRQLAAQNPVTFNPDLAMALNNLAVFQIDSGNEEAAIAAAKESVDLYRKLAVQLPSVYNYDFAGSLHNYARHLAKTGNHTAALTTSEEAVSLFRQLAAQNPSTYNPELAMALNNLACNLADAGKHGAALSRIREAISLYRQLAAQNSTTHNRNLAMALNNLAGFRANTGEHKIALASSQEATTLYRELSAQDPTAYRPDLAMSLSGVASLQLEAGNHQASLTSIEEAVNLYLALTAISPEVFTPKLVSATCLRANVLQKLGRRTDARNAFTPAMDQLPMVTRARLLLARARWDESGADVDLIACALEADKHDNPDMLGPIRRAIATAILEHDVSSPRLPDWARVTVTKDQADKITRWSNTQSIEARIEILKSDWATPTSQDVSTLKALARLYVDTPGIGQLSAHVDKISSTGIEAFSNELDTLNRSVQILAAWQTAHRTNTIPTFLHTYNTPQHTPNDAPVPVKQQNLQTPQIRDTLLTLAKQHLNPAANTELETALTLSDLCEPRIAAALLGSINDAADALEILFKNKNWQAQALALTRLPELERTHYGTFAAALATAHQGNNPDQATTLLETAWNRADQYDRQQILANLTAAVAQSPEPSRFIALLERAQDLERNQPYCTRISTAP